MKISELMDGIKKKDIVLPEFQREYVWTREQAKELVVSLLKSYPVGSLLFWKTDQPPDLKNVDEIPEKLGTIQVMLDGQQRLTTLYMLITNEIPPYYKDTDIQYDPRELYYNLDDGVFQYYQPSRMKDNALWFKVVDCYIKKNIDVFKIAKERATNDHEAFELANKYNENLNRLKNIVNIDLPVQNVPSDASLDDSIDIFDRVNSKGTKLTDAELALTHVTGKWSLARRVLKAKIDNLGNKHFLFDLTFMTRALTGVVTERALFYTIHTRHKDELVEKWKRLEKILDYLISLLPQKAFIHSTEDLNSTNVLIPIVVYLSIHDGKFQNDNHLKNAIHWLYAAHTWSRYTSQLP